MPYSGLGIYYEELGGSPTLSLSPGNLSAERKFVVAWDDYINFTLELYGLRTVVGGQPIYTSRLPFPGLNQPNFRVSNVQIKPWDDDLPGDPGMSTLTSATATYPEALITASYRNDNSGGLPDGPTIPDGTYLTYDGDHAEKPFAIPGSQTYWMNLNKSRGDNHQAIVPNPTHIHRLTWHLVLQPPWEAFRTCLGRVNGSAFLGAPIGALIFRGWRPRTSFTFNSEFPIWDIDMLFEECSHLLSDGETTVGWNYDFNPIADGTGENWQYVSLKDLVTPLIGFSSFPKLFQFAS